MRGYGAAGFFLVIGFILMWAGFSGRTGSVVAAVLAPQALLTPDQLAGTSA